MLVFRVNSVFIDVLGRIFYMWNLIVLELNNLIVVWYFEVNGLGVFRFGGWG